uniref:Uncharacterized protein n=1 Tax=Rhizophora mucronata TaxID=61149 RepID=A0A2P2PD47_RHIMU
MLLHDYLPSLTREWEYITKEVPASIGPCAVTKIEQCKHTAEFQKMDVL